MADNANGDDVVADSKREGGTRDADLSPTMRQALVVVLDNEPRWTIVAWKTGPRVVASGTAEALKKRGLVEKRFDWQWRHDEIRLTDEGREIALELHQRTPASEGSDG